MSNSSFQSEIPKARINLKLDLHTGGASKKTELPLKLLVAGDFSNGQESAPLSERKKVNLNKNNFDSVLSEYSPKVNLTVKNTLAGDGSEDNINLTFQSMKDFTPEQVSRQIPQLKAMLSMRNLLRDLKANASFAFASNMVRSFINNGWCVQIRGPQAGGAVQDLPIHLYDLGTGNQVKIPSEVMIPETREFEFANLGFIPLSYYKNRDYACFFSANSTQKPALYDTADATANSRINARLPYIFLLSRIAHYLKLIQRENIGTTKDRRLLELELNTWVRSLVTEMTDPGDELQASHPLRDAKVTVEDIEDNPGFFRVKLYAVPHFQVEGMDVNLSLVSQMPKAKS
ncbi:type VI secretion system contractile sheath large subunit [Pantoea agglomerans]|uniref:type VI secretion system contractile sheath large subunit n=1 Tax=Enterobacter agglomerans TaxID=549 RepID=UPI0018D78CF7